MCGLVVQEAHGNVLCFYGVLCGLMFCGVGVLEEVVGHHSGHLTETEEMALGV